MPTPQRGQYLMHVHNHITPALAAVDSCFALIGANQHGKATGQYGEGKPAYQRPFTAKASAKHSFKQQLVGNCKSKTVVPRHAYGDGIRKIDLCAPKDFETTKCDP